MQKPAQRPALLLAGLTLAVLAGCANQTQPLYSWNGYQSEVYSYLKGSQQGLEAQIASLEKALSQTRASGQTVPPGYHAHLGMLYAQSGRGDEVQPQFDHEKTLYPESQAFISFLEKTFQNNPGVVP
ncbi:MAG: DUF4810 domain-containing protein [Comamonas sp.]